MYVYLHCCVCAFVFLEMISVWWVWAGDSRLIWETSLCPLVLFWGLDIYSGRSCMYVVTGLRINHLIEELCYVYLGMAVLTKCRYFTHIFWKQYIIILVIQLILLELMLVIIILNSNTSDNHINNKANNTTGNNTINNTNTIDTTNSNGEEHTVIRILL